MTFPRKGTVTIRVMLLVVLAALVVIGGCDPVTLFLEPIESSEVRIREDAILGRWTSEGLSDFFDNDMIVAIDGGRRGAYTINISQKEFEPGDINDLIFNSYLVTLGNRTFIDIVQKDALLKIGHRLNDLPDTIRRHTLPVHIVGRIDVEGETITVEWLSAEWLQEYLEAHPAELEYLKESLLVISDRETVQNFLVAHGKEWATSEEPWIFERVE